jgi:hypothetical protein
MKNQTTRPTPQGTRAIDSNIDILRNRPQELIKAARERMSTQKERQARRLACGWYWLRDAATRSARLVPPNHTSSV